MSQKHLASVPTQEDIQRLLSTTSVITGACELDLLVFLCRHPYALLTNEQLATFLGYDMKQAAEAIDAFIEIGLLERTQNPTHAARMYRLMLGDPDKGRFKTLLELASTRQGRQSVLRALKSPSPRLTPDRSASTRSLRAIA